MPIQQHKLQERRLESALHSALLILVLVVLLATMGWLLAGLLGAIVAAVACAVSLLLSGRISPWMALRVYRARHLPPQAAPVLYELLGVLARRAELPRTPAVFVIPSRLHTAFTTGSGDEAAIAVSAGIFEDFSHREIAGILGHELSHIRNRDTVVMGIADTASRLTSSLANLGLLLVLLNLPLFLLGRAPVPWLLVGLLVFSPTICGLVQLALSRAREFRADLDAAALTHDPRGLASALTKLERIRRSLIERILLPEFRVAEPSLLRTHPPTEERVRRLLELELPDPVALTTGWPEAGSTRGAVLFPDRLRVTRRPRWHVGGVWY